MSKCEAKMTFIQAINVRMGKLPAQNDIYPSCKHQNEQMRGQNDVYPSYKHQNEQTVGPK
ncbi:hypothetical protein [Gracilibacillus dipsosauri]|uniref:hypothetical protein n=1 Tax=Gracilibacillus dipsosauri TaxID=178340 RepID=UPI0024095197